MLKVLFWKGRRSEDPQIIFLHHDYTLKDSIGKDKVVPMLN